MFFLKNIDGIVVPKLIASVSLRNSCIKHKAT
jgi:hypothetical protein